MFYKSSVAKIYDTATCGRIAQQDFTFSNGVTIPKGTELAVPILALSMDNSYFPSAEEFDGLRFYNEGEIIPAHRLSSSTCNPPLLGFGYGKHVWYVVPLKFHTKENYSKLTNVI